MNESRIRCECGEVTGTACEGDVTDGRVVVEYMPDQHRQSHIAAGNRGVWPHNGSRRLWLTEECAALLVASEPDWTSIVERWGACSGSAIERAGSAIERAEAKTYRYTIYDSDPQSSSGTAWDTHTSVEVEAGSAEEARDEALRVAEREARASGEYEPGDSIYVLVWDSEDVLVAAGGRAVGAGDDDDQGEGEEVES